MSGPRKLDGRQIAVLAADGFEKVELSAPMAALKQAGARVVVIALHPGKIRGMNVHQPSDLVQVDMTIDEVRAADFDALLVPGGYISPDLLRQSAKARAFVRDMHDLGKPVALLSQAPSILTSAGLAAGRRLTSWPGMRDDLVNAGAIWLNQDLVRDGNLLSGRGAQALTPFIQDIIPFFAGEPAQDIPPDRATSDPQLEEPSGMPGQSLHLLSTPSVGTMLGLALLGAGVVAANRDRRKKQPKGAGPGQPPSL